MNKIIIITLFYLMAYSANSQVVRRMTNKVANSIVSINNSSNSNIKFLFGMSGDKMNIYELLANNTWNSPVLNYDPLVKIQTQSHIGTYKLKRGLSYAIYWDKGKKYWAIR